MTNAVRPRKLLYLLSDGGRARLVKFDRDRRAYVSLTETDNGPALAQAQAAGRGSSRISTRQAFSDAPFSGEARSAARHGKEAFMAQAMDVAVAALKDGGFDGLVLAAPPQLIGVLCKEASSRRAPVLAALRKDLTKTPDHELGEWLDHVHDVRP